MSNDRVEPEVGQEMELWEKVKNNLEKTFSFLSNNISQALVKHMVGGRAGQAQENLYMQKIFICR